MGVWRIGVWIPESSCVTPPPAVGNAYRQKPLNPQAHEQGTQE